MLGCFYLAHWLYQSSYQVSNFLFSNWPNSRQCTISIPPFGFPNFSGGIEMEHWFNQLTTSVSHHVETSQLIAEQINWLASIWWGTLVVNKLECFNDKKLSILKISMSLFALTILPAHRNQAINININPLRPNPQNG